MERCRHGVCGGACVQGWRVWWGLCAGMEGVVGPVCRDGGCGGACVGWRVWRGLCAGMEGVEGPVCRDGGCGGACVQGWRVWRGLCAGMEGVEGPVCRDGRWGVEGPVCRDGRGVWRGLCAGMGEGCGGHSAHLSCALQCVHSTVLYICCPVDARLLVLSSPTLASAS